MADFFKSLLGSEKHSDSEGPGIAKEIGEKARSMKDAGDALKPAPVAEPAKPAYKPSSVDKVNPSGGYGTGPSEKRLNTDYLKSPTAIKGVMHKGGTVPETGPYVMKAGEKVLTPEQHGHLKNALSLASSALSHEPEQDAEPKKEVKEMHLRKGANGGFIAKHIHAHFSHPDEEHVHPTMDHVHDSLESHWGMPNDGEAESESEKDESPGVTAIQKAVGMEK